MSMKTEHTKAPGTLRIVSLGDVHLGHPQTPTATIIRNLDKYCTNEVVLKPVDLLVITGDLFDRLLQNADENVVLIHRWITRLLYKCSYLNVAIRIVEGTPSHDRGQSVFFVEQARNANIEVDLHYATTLSIEYIERWDINILYVPDEWRPEPSETLAEVRQLLAEHQLEQVDFAIMHGAFEYQLPEIARATTHDSKTYLELVKYLILIGHVHLMTQHERILAAGSTDRICHGEEGPKGYFDITVRPDGSFDPVFVENAGAKRYVTVSCHDMDSKKAFALLQSTVTELPPASAIRIRCNINDPISGDLDHIKKTYPDYHWTLKIDNPEQQTKTSVVELFKTLDLSEFVEITASNIRTLLEPELDKIITDPTVRTRTIEHLERLTET